MPSIKSELVFILEIIKDSVFFLKRGGYPPLLWSIGEALGLKREWKWVRDLQLVDMDFEVDSKTVVNGIYGKKRNVLDFSVIINECRCILVTNLVNYHVKFVRRKTNKEANSHARVASSLVSFLIFYQYSNMCTNYYHE